MNRAGSSCEGTRRSELDDRGFLCYLKSVELLSKHVLRKIVVLRARFQAIHDVCMRGQIAFACKGSITA